MMPLFFLAAFLAAAPAAAQPPRLAISLAEAEAAALARSPLLKAAETDLASALAQTDAQLAQLAPRVTLEGSYQYQTEVPQVSLAPGAPPFQFGDHHNWSVGPALNYTLWDTGGLLKAWRGQKALAASQEAQRDLVRRQVLLMTRLAYFEVQLALEQQRAQTDSLRLAQAQYRDIDARRRGGAASRVDWLSAHQQVLDRRRDARAAQADVSAALRALFALTGQGAGADLTAPLDSRIEPPLPEGVGEASLLVALQPLEEVRAALERAAAARPDEAHPQLLVYARQAEGQRLGARSLSAGLWPKISLSYKSQYDYPELPLLRRYWQNAVGLGLTMPLFERGRTRAQARAQAALAESAESRRQEARDELSRDWGKARDQYAALRDIEALDAESVEETSEIARLRYASYKDGASTILDVESANLSAVLARVAAARTRTQALIQLATLASLAAPGDRP